MPNLLRCVDVCVLGQLDDTRSDTWILGPASEPGEMREGPLNGMELKVVNFASQEMCARGLEA